MTAVLLASSLAITVFALCLDVSRKRARRREMHTLATTQGLLFCASGPPAGVPTPELLSPFIRSRLSNGCSGLHHGYTVAAFDFTPLYRGEASGSVAGVHVRSRAVSPHVIPGVQLSQKDGWLFAVPAVRRPGRLSPQQIVELWNKLIELAEASHTRDPRLTESVRAQA